MPQMWWGRQLCATLTCSVAVVLLLSTRGDRSGRTDTELPMFEITKVNERVIGQRLLRTTRHK